MLGKMNLKEQKLGSKVTHHFVEDGILEKPTVY